MLTTCLSKEKVKQDGADYRGKRSVVMVAPQTNGVCGQGILVRFLYQSSRVRVSPPFKNGADNHSLWIKRQSQSPYPKVEKAYLDPWLKVSGGGLDDL